MTNYFNGSYLKIFLSTLIILWKPYVKCIVRYIFKLYKKTLKSQESNFLIDVICYQEDTYS